MRPAEPAHVASTPDRGEDRERRFGGGAKARLSVGNDGTDRDDDRAARSSTHSTARRRRCHSTTAPPTANEQRRVVRRSAEARHPSLAVFAGVELHHVERPEEAPGAADRAPRPRSAPATCRAHVVERPAADTRSATCDWSPGAADVEAAGAVDRASRARLPGRGTSDRSCAPAKVMPSFVEMNVGSSEPRQVEADPRREHERARRRRAVRAPAPSHARASAARTRERRPGAAPAARTRHAPSAASPQSAPSAAARAKRRAGRTQANASSMRRRPSSAVSVSDITSPSLTQMLGEIAAIPAATRPTASPPTRRPSRPMRPTRTVPSTTIVYRCSRT